jgi:hypothetical protein
MNCFVLFLFIYIYYYYDNQWANSTRMHGYGQLMFLFLDRQRVLVYSRISVLLFLIAGVKNVHVCLYKGRQKFIYDFQYRHSMCIYMGKRTANV